MTEERKERPSKSAAKRDAQAIRELADELLSLNTAERARLGCDETLEDALALAARLKRGAARRQMQRVARLLRERPDIATNLARHVEAQHARERDERRQFKQTEQWREAFLAGHDERLTALSDAGDDWRELLALRERYRASFNEREQKEIYRNIFRLMTKIRSAQDG